MTTENMKQNRRERLISKIYSIYDAMSYISNSQDVSNDSRDVIVNALQNDLTLKIEFLVRVEQDPEDDDDENDVYRQYHRVTYPI